MSARKNYFSYSAAGSALGGILTDPTPLTVPTQAMVSLSPSGGYGTATMENFGIDGLLTARKGTTTVQGDLKQTELTVTLEDINILNRLTVSRIVMHLVAETPLGAYEARITPLGSLMEGLRVDGKDIPLNCSAAVFDRYPGWAGMEQAYIEGALKGLIIAPGTLGEPCSAERLDGCETRAGNVRATLYSLEGYSGPYPVVNGGLRVKDLATLYLGEYRMTKFSRRLTMLRVELGCDLGGSMGFGDGAGNGQWEPPD
jgi:hypothetical protein